MEEQPQKGPAAPSQCWLLKSRWVLGPPRPEARMGAPGWLGSEKGAPVPSPDPCPQLWAALRFSRKPEPWPEPTCNSNCPTALLSNSSCMCLTAQGPPVGLPSAYVLRKLVSGGSSGVQSELCSALKKGEGYRDPHHPEAQAEGASARRSMPHSKHSRRLRPVEARAGPGHTMMWDLGRGPLETQGLV